MSGGNAPRTEFIRPAEGGREDPGNKNPLPEPRRGRRNEDAGGSLLPGQLLLDHLLEDFVGLSAADELAIDEESGRAGDPGGHAFFLISHDFILSLNNYLSVGIFPRKLC